MDEKILIESKHFSKKTMTTILLAVSLCVLIIFEACTFYNVIIKNVSTFSHIYDVNYPDTYATYQEHQARGYCDYNDRDKICWQCDEDMLNFPNKSAYVTNKVFNYQYECSFLGVTTKINGPFGVILWGALCGAVLSAPLVIIVFYWLKSYTMVVTDKRVYGKITFGKRVDIPLDSISAVSIISMLRGVTVASSSGRISLLLIMNSNEIYEQINSLLLERQNNTPKPIEPQLNIPLSHADELKKYKELLDMGVITQEEFDAKKKQLLEL